MTMTRALWQRPHGPRVIPVFCFQIFLFFPLEWIVSTKTCVYTLE